MNKEEILKTILDSLKTIAPDTEPEKLSHDQNIKQSLDLDSFDHLRFIVSIDKKLGINIPEENYGKVTTINELVNYITQNQVTQVRDQKKNRSE